jgi:hypothetical protein
MMPELNEIVVYHSDELSIRLEVRLEEETIWLTQQQIVELFDTSKANISEHIKHIFESGELKETTTVRNFRTVRTEGNRKVSRELAHYSLDVIISVGYRVNSIRGTQFRIWANEVLKSYLLKGYAVNERIGRLEKNVHGLVGRMDHMELQINANLPPKQGIFYDGQVFDAYVFVADLVKRAKKNIYLIDNYIDETVLTLLSKRTKNVTTTIYTKNFSKQLQLDLKKHNRQYPEIKILEFKEAHDRFLILDEKDCYHIGASLKDLGKKWFAFSKMEGMTEMIVANLQKVKIDD